MDTPDPGHVQRAVGARYEVMDLVGVGGMGCVFRARHRELGSLVAIKVLPPEVAASRMREERFRREAQLAAQLSHPNVVPVYEFDTHEGLTFLIMPFVRGRTFESVMAERPQLPLPDLLRVLADVGAALDFAHARSVVHRDVKPSNIMIEEETQRALLTDFGVALARASHAGSLTAPGTAIGTPAYMAPEQMTGSERVDGRADLFALALVAYEALTGELPSAGVDCPALATALHDRRSDLRPSEATALVAPLADQPSQRPASAAEWLKPLGRSTSRRWRLTTAAFATLLLGVIVWLTAGRLGTAPTTAHSLAVMPFYMLGSNRDLPPAQLPGWFQGRVPPVPNLTIISAAKTASAAGEQAPSFNDAQAAATQLGATHFVQPSLELLGSQARMSARLYVTKSGKQLLQTTDEVGQADSLSEIMDRVWVQLLRQIVKTNFAPMSSVTMPHSLTALLAYANAEEAFRRGDYKTALEEYNNVVAADSSFGMGYFRRALVVAQVDPHEMAFRDALAGARRHQSGLEPADSLMLEGYALLLEKGDGHAALARFKAAVALAPDQPQAWLVLGEFYYHFGALFDQGLFEAEAAFDTVYSLSPNFAPAVAHLISFAHMRDDQEATAELIHRYESFGTASVVTETVGIVDTLLLHGIPAKVALLKTLGSHSFTALEYLAFQVQEFGKPDERRGAGRDILRALARRAATDSDHVLALRLGVGADLGEGWVDSARARLAGAATPATQRERDMWLVLARVAGPDSLGDLLGDWRAAAGRLDAAAGTGRGDEIVHWMLARLDRDRARHVAALERLAADSAPLPLALKLDLEARRALATRDSARALQLWQEATQRYAVLRVPFDLAASLWWLRRDLAIVARARGDTALATRTCESLLSLIGYVDLVVRHSHNQFCPPGSVAAP